MNQTEEAIRMTHEMQQRTEVMFQHFCRGPKKVSAGSRNWPRCRPERKQEHTQLQGPLQETKGQAQPQGGSEKRKAYTQLQGTGETRSRDGAEGKKTNWCRCEIVRYMATKDCRSERPDGRRYRGARWSGLLLPCPTLDVARSGTEGGAD